MIVVGITILTAGLGDFAFFSAELVVDVSADVSVVVADGTVENISTDLSIAEADTDFEWVDKTIEGPDWQVTQNGWKMTFGANGKLTFASQIIEEGDDSFVFGSHL